MFIRQKKLHCTFVIGQQMVRIEDDLFIALSDKRVYYLVCIHIIPYIEILQTDNVHARNHPHIGNINDFPMPSLFRVR